MTYQAYAMYDKGQSKMDLGCKRRDNDMNRTTHAFKVCFTKQFRHRCCWYSITFRKKHRMITFFITTTKIETIDKQFYYIYF